MLFSLLACSILFRGFHAQHVVSCNDFPVGFFTAAFYAGFRFTCRNFSRRGCAIDRPGLAFNSAASWLRSARGKWER
jgi:hypothetical protein